MSSDSEKQPEIIDHLHQLDEARKEPTAAQVEAADRELHYAQVNYEKAARMFGRFDPEDFEFKVFVNVRGQSRDALMAFEPYAVVRIGKAIEAILHKDKRKTAILVEKTLRTRRDEAAEDFNRLTLGNARRRR